MRGRIAVRERPSREPRRDQEKRGGAGPSREPGRDQEQGGGAGFSRLDNPLFQFFLDNCSTDIVTVQHSC